MITDNCLFTEYYHKIMNHKLAVFHAWFDIFRKALIQNIGKLDYTMSDIQATDFNILQHDNSKLSVEEFEAYCDYFYPDLVLDRSIRLNDFKIAQLHHVHNNRHHWQYWIQWWADTQCYTIQDMDYPSIFEMLCDWHSFSSQDPNDTAIHWYSQLSDSLLLSEKTRVIVEELLHLFDRPVTI